MKKLSLVMLLILALGLVWAQGTESFDNCTPPTGTNYGDGNFVGDAGFTWYYGHAQDEGNYPITGNGILLRRASDSYLEATIPGGVGNFSFQYRKAYTGNNVRQLELLVNGVQVTTTPTFGDDPQGEDGTIHDFSYDVNTGGNVTIKIKNVLLTTQNRHVVIDNISWTGYSGTVPTWDVDPTLLTGLDYVLDNGPSDHQTFNIDGYNLGGYFMVSIPELSNFEIGYDYSPEKAPQEWGTMIELSGYDEVHHTICARLKAGLPVGDYDEDVTVSYITQGDQGEVYDNKYVTLNGSVTSSDPTWVVEPTELYGFTYPEGSGPSAYKTFTITGANLDNRLFRVHAPVSGHYEISDNGDIYSSYLEFFSVDGTIQKTIYVRLVAGLPQGDYTWYNNEPERVAVAYPYPSPAPIDPVYVTLGGDVTAPAVRYWVDFDNDGETKRSYAAADLVLSGYNWNLAEVLVSDPPLSNDWFEYKRSARFRGYGASAMTMLEDKPWGGGDISFKYRQYGGDTQKAWVAEYSINQGGDWTQIGDPFTPTADVQTFTGSIGDSRSIRLRFRNADENDTGTSDRRWNLDSIDLADYYDFYKDVPKTVDEVVITMRSSNANYDYTRTPSTLPDPEFNVLFHRCITLLDNGPWQIDTGVSANKQPDSYWAAYKLHDEWYAAEMVGGQATLYVPAGTVTANDKIELLIGYGKNPTVPVTLSHFSATINAQNFVQLTWIAQTETNVLGYNVYRNTSDELSSAIKISELIEANNSSEATTYTYLDQELEQNGTYYYWLENVDLDGTMSYHGPVSVVFSIEDGEGGTPGVTFKTRLENAYPNPFNPNTNIRYQLKEAGDVKIDIYNARGQLVRSFSQTHDAAGYYQINWDGRDSSGKTVSSGVYQYKMTSGKYHSTKKMVMKK